ncbi:MAG: hypothetical protein ACLP1X_28490 [Polyangiaceae bacterium]
MPANGKTNGTITSTKRAAVSRPTPAQQRARREYVRRSGHKFTQEEIDKIRSQWRD